MPNDAPSAKRILFVIAMEVEARGLREAFGITGEPTQLHPAFPARMWSGSIGTNKIAVAVNGRDERFDVESIASQPAVTTTLHAIEAFSPTLVISAGTAGGWNRRGGEIGKVYLADACVFHDRRIAIPGWDAYGIGTYPVADLRPAAAAIGLETGTVTTGNSLDAPPADVATMEQSGAVAKEMEAAAVGWICERMSVPFAALKAITDLVDDPEDTAEQFDRNLKMATTRLAETAQSLVSWLHDTQSLG